MLRSGIMKRTALLLLVGLGIVGWASVYAQPEVVEDPTHRPLFMRNASVHDPSVIRVGDTYYVFGSHLASAKSDDLMNWTQISTNARTGNPLVPNPRKRCKKL